MTRLFLNIISAVYIVGYGLGYILGYLAQRRDRKTYKRFKEDVKPAIDFDDIEQYLKDMYNG